MSAISVILGVASNSAPAAYCNHVARLDRGYGVTPDTLLCTVSPFSHHSNPTFPCGRNLPLPEEYTTEPSALCMPRPRRFARSPVGMW